MTRLNRIPRSALFMLLAVFVATQLKAAEDDSVARVLLSFGTVEAVSLDGSVRALARGDRIYEGDTIRSGASSRAQIRFTDGARMALRPETELSVDDYEFAEAAPPESDRTALSLRRGGFRTATGRVAQRNPFRAATRSVGEVNRSSYRVSTPFAVVGVRGTDWSASISDVGQGPNLFLGVDEGGITAANNGGSLDVGVEDGFSFAQINSFDDAPQGLDAPPPQVRDAFSSTGLPSEDDTGEGPGGDGGGDAGAGNSDESGEDSDDSGDDSDGGDESGDDSSESSDGGDESGDDSSESSDGG